MAVELATGYVSIVPSARGIQGGIAEMLGADAETINAHFSLVFREGEEWLRWTK